jgi:hypothetical protein
MKIPALSREGVGEGFKFEYLIRIRYNCRAMVTGPLQICRQGMLEWNVLIKIPTKPEFLIEIYPPK